jgi:hypothetical protein
VLGKFISVDPIMDLTDPQQWNAYSYANNSPVTLSDPTGLKAYAHDGYMSNPKPPVQEALPKDKKTMWGNGVARQAPTAGQPGSYVPASAPSTSYGGGYYSSGSGTGGKSGGGTGSTADKKPFVKPLNLQKGQRGTQATSARDPEFPGCAGKCLNRGEVTGEGWDWAAFGMTIGIVGAVIGLVAFVGAALGVAAVAGISLAALAITGVVLGGIATAIDCVSGGFDGSCGMGIISTALGGAGFGFAGLSGRLGGATSGGVQTVADDVANLGITADMLSIGAGATSTGAGEVARRTELDW